VYTLLRANKTDGIEEMRPLSGIEYKLILDDLQKLGKQISSLTELRRILNESWFDRVRDVANRPDEQLVIDEGSFGLLRILYGIGILDPILLNKRLEKIAAIAHEQGRDASYRKTRGELASTQYNQVLGSLFEINIVYAALQSCSSVELYPKAGKGGSDVEAKLTIDDRPVFIEAKALTPSQHDVSGYGGSHPIDSMIKQIYDALNEKLSHGKQLQILSGNFPTVLFLTLGFNADEISGPRGIESYFEEYQSNISSVFLFASALCRNLVKIVHNENSTLPLSRKELEVLENIFCRVIANDDDTLQNGID
jgi:hypothetical protein